MQEINRLLKMHLQMADMMKKMGKQRGGLLGSLFGGGQPAVDMAGSSGCRASSRPSIRRRCRRSFAICRSRRAAEGLPGLSTQRAVARTRWRGVAEAAGRRATRISRFQFKKK